MKILYVSQYFPPEMGAPSARVHELSKEWVKLGHDVTVLTGFANHPTGRKAARDRWRITRREHVDGIEVVRSYIWATPNKGTLKRMISYATFMASAGLIGSIRVTRPDVIVATSPQLLCALAGYLLARRFRSPFVFEVRDLWPESILAVEAMAENPVVQGLRHVAGLLYRNAHRIVTVGKGYRDEIHRLYDIPREQMDIIPNGIDTDLFFPDGKDNELRREYGWGDRFVVLYLGTHGMAHALNVVLDAAQRLQDRPDILFAFVGEGAEKENLKAQAARHGLRNVQFIDHQPKSRVPLFYSSCDLGLVTLRNTRLFQSALPSKIFEYLGMARPILLSVDGDARRILEEAQAGWYVPPEDTSALCEAILKAYRCRDDLHRMGTSGRNYVLQNYDRKALAAEYLQILMKINH